MASIVQPYVATVIGPKQPSPLGELINTLAMLGNMWGEFQKGQHQAQTGKTNQQMVQNQSVAYIMKTARNRDDVAGLVRALGMDPKIIPSLQNMYDIQGQEVEGSKLKSQWGHPSSGSAGSTSTPVRPRMEDRWGSNSGSSYAFEPPQNDMSERLFAQGGGQVSADPQMQQMQQMLWGGS